MGRDLILKLVDKNSEQHRIFDELLHDIAVFCDSTTFPCILPPINIVETPHKYCIVAMPM